MKIKLEYFYKTSHSLNYPYFLLSKNRDSNDFNLINEDFLNNLKEVLPETLFYILSYPKRSLSYIYGQQVRNKDN